jgi:hypothetical protein
VSKLEKLLAKLKSETITAGELRTLMGQLGVEYKGARGSHEKYVFGEKLFILATHSKDLKRYQIKQAREFLGIK